MRLAGLPALRQLAPGRTRMAAAGRTAFTAAHRVVNRVHRHTADRRTDAEVALAACLAELNRAPVLVAHGPNGRLAAGVEDADFAGRELERDRVAGASHDLRIVAGAAGELGALTGNELNAVDHEVKSAKNIVPQSSGWIKTVREAIGMTVSQLAARLGVTQPRITKMESNEDNLKLSTMKKAAEAMNCEFVYYFKPKTTFQNLVDEQAQKKAAEVLKTVNVNMALENQEIAEDEAVKDFASDLINTKIKQIWD